MNDIYSNYFCQKFYKLLEFNDKIHFLYRVILLDNNFQLKKSISFIGNDKIGTHALQHIICSLCTKDEKDILISYIEDSFDYLVNDKLGVHVLEKLIICFDEEILKSLYNNILKNFLKLANDPNTLCLVFIFI